MKKFTKLALVSSMAISANAMAMQAMDDSALSATTGQDGINIGIGISRITIDELYVHDNDGLSTRNAQNAIVPTTSLGGTGNAGAIVMKGAADEEITLTDGTTKINRNGQALFIGANYSDGGRFLLGSKNLADLKIDSDGSDAGAFLNIAAEVSGLEIHIGEIGVAKSNTYGASTTSIQRGASASNYAAILSGLSIKTGQLTANVQLGSAPQGAMIKLNSVIQGGLTIEKLGILDNSTKNKLIAQLDVPRVDSNNQPVLDDLTGEQIIDKVDVRTKEAGEIYIDSIQVTDTNSKNLTVDADVKVYNNAYTGTGASEKLAKAANITIVSNSGAHDLYVKGIHLGNRSAGSIGDVEVIGMQTFYGADYTPGSMITISGR